MDKEIIDEVQFKLLKMNKIIAKLDPAIRNTAFEIMVPYYFDDQPTKKQKNGNKSKGGKGKSSAKEADTSDLESFISSFEHKKPKDNIMLLTAWLYSQQGAYSIQAKEIKELADSCGLVIPNRSDNTMRAAKNKGKSLFKQQGSP